MSLAVFAHSPDLQKLRDDGYAVILVNSAAGTVHLLVSDIPYVTPDRRVARGTIVTPLGIVADKAEPPADHTVHFIGEAPCDQHGNRLTNVINSEGVFPIANGIDARFYFSNKSADGSNFADHFAKMTHYTNLLEVHAQALDPSASAKTFPPVEDTEGTSPFVYADSATSRAGTTVYAERLTLPAIGIVGLGGTGSYVLDFVAKTPVGEIHLFDGDDLLSHNAFRAPAAATLDELQARPKKVDYYATKYSAMKRQVIPHPYALTGDNAAELASMSFVFLCMEGGTTKRQLVESLEAHGISFVDVGMGVQATTSGLAGSVQVTTSTEQQRDHLRQRVQLVDIDEDDIYEHNIQIAELNALNAALAVIKWKKLLGFYRDEAGEHYSAYRVDSNDLINDVTAESAESAA